MQKVYLGNFEPSHFANKAVLVRTDYNTPLYRNENGEYEVISDARIRNSFETLRFLLQGGAKCIVCSHLGRPHGSFEEQFSMKAVYNRLRLLLTDITVKIVGNCIGSEVEQAKRALNKGEVLVLENLRFHVGEEENNRDFARQLAVGVDIFVNEAFSASHRAHASTSAIQEFIQLRYAGFSLHRELNFLYNAIAAPARPAVAVVGGMKVSTKMDILMNLMSSVDKILIGGAMVYTFYKALGHGVGDCFVEEKAIPTAAEIVKRAAESDVILRFATDLTVVPTRAYKVKQAKRVSMTDDSILHDFEYCPRNVSYTDIPEHWTGVDIGPESVVAFSLELEECNTIILSGPMGVVEEPDYSYGTLELLRKMERRTRMGAITIVCGGQTVAAIEEHNMHDFTHVSMGGGAALELLGNRELPGVTILNDEEEGMEIL